MRDVNTLIRYSILSNCHARAHVKLRFRQIKQYLKDSFYPVDAPETLYIRWYGKLSNNILPELNHKNKTKSLRSLASKYQVSYETIRRALKTRSQ